MPIDPRDYIENDKRFPNSLSGDAGKILAVDPTGVFYEHIPPTGQLVGQVIMWFFDTPPTGYLPCNDGVFNYDDYPALGVLFGAVSGGTFTVPKITFPKNSNGLNTGTQELESVGTHGHTADIVPDHTHVVTVDSVANHSHSVSIVSNGSHAHSTGGGTSVNHAVSSAAPRDITMYAGTSTGTAGSHTHGASAGYSGAHTHTANADSNGAHTPVIEDHIGVNQPACTLINFCIRY